MVKEEKRTIQIGLRIEKELLDEISFLAKNEGFDKMAWIRRALANSINQERDSISREAVKDYVNLIIDKEELKEFTSFSKIPKDIIDARKETLSKIKKGYGKG